LSFKEVRETIDPNDVGIVPLKGFEERLNEIRVEGNEEGITPVRLLPSSNNIVNAVKLVAYMGIGPVNLFELSCNVTSLGIDNTGIVFVNELVERRRLVSAFKEATDEGMLPTNLFALIHNAINLLNNPICVGIVPVRQFAFNCRYSNEAKPPKDVGIVLTNLFP
jgi:hypothetical protein